MRERGFMVNNFREKYIRGGYIYHITQRAPGNEVIFVEKGDYLNFLSLLKEWVKKFNLDIFCFCLMKNHYHILLKLNLPNLSEAMHQLNTSYAKRYNVKYKRKGHVFCGVYRAAMCMDDVHLIAASLYIHLNPLKAGLVNNPLGYRWSSLNLYFNPETESFVKNKYILRILHSDLDKTGSIYRHMIRDNADLKYENITENHQAVVNFSKGVYKRFFNIFNTGNIRDDFVKKEIELDDLIERYRRRKQEKSPDSRRGVIYLVEQLKSRGYTLSAVAELLDVSRQSLYKKSLVRTRRG
jgi:putative transposase